MFYEIKRHQCGNFLGGFPSFFSDFWPEFKKLVFIQQSKNDIKGNKLEEARWNSNVSRKKS